VHERGWRSDGAWQPLRTTGAGKESKVFFRSSSKGTWNEELSVGGAHKRLIRPTPSTKMAAGKDIKPPKPLPPPNSDFYQLAETLPPEELTILKQVRSFMESKVAPIINKYWVEDSFPFELLPAFKDLNIGGLGMQGYGCRGGSKLLTGLVAMEMARTDGSFATFFGVHSGLAMGSIYATGSEEQKQKWLPPMARLEKIGCFGLTEPLVGSGTSGGLTTTAKKDPNTVVEIRLRINI
jgi:hypothetical protein